MSRIEDRFDSEDRSVAYRKTQQYVYQDGKKIKQRGERTISKYMADYGIAIELKDQRTHDVLREFVDGNGDVIECFDAKLLENIIKIIVLTASKVKSSSTAVRNGASITVVQEVQQQVQQALSEVDDWEW